jgi:hypothetical protein
MSGLSELLIDYRLVPVRDPTGIYGQRDQVWAEPSISDGAAKLLRLTESAELRRRLSSRGAQGVAGQSEDWEAGMFGELVLAVSIGRPSA